MTEQKSLVHSDYREGQLNALWILEQHVAEMQARGKQFWSSEQLYQVIRSTRLTLEEKGG